MAIVTISKAAKLVKRSRTILYRDYINKGKLSTCVDDSGKKGIDTAELLRVFGTLKVDNDDSQQDSQRLQKLTERNYSDSSVLEMKAKGLEDLLKVREEQLNDALLREKEAITREAFLQEHIKEITQTFKVLEDKRGQNNKLVRWNFWEWLKNH